MTVIEDFEGWAHVEDKKVQVNGLALDLPDLAFMGELGRGANAVVFEAIDLPLRRFVAVKIWNTRGQERAQSETVKIANFNHPLIVSTYRFGWATGYPYSVMELVRGSSGKKWLEEERTLDERISIWEQYSKALRHIHRSGNIHGDPHLGNVLIFRPPSDNGEDSTSSTQWRIKIADTGTSEVWESHKKIEEREAKLVHETASRLFYLEDFKKLWRAPKLTYQDTLWTLDLLCEYLSWSRMGPAQDRASENAWKLVEWVTKAPFFDLDVLMAQIQKSYFTDQRRFARRLNAKFLRTSNVLDAPETINETTKEFYACLQQDFVASRTNSGS